MYTIHLHDEVLQALETLPHDALVSYAEAITVLEMNPQVGRPLNPSKPDGLQELLFADGCGSILYLIIEHAVETHLVSVQYIG